MSIYRKKWVRRRLKTIEEYEATHGQIQHFEFNTVGIIGPTGSGKTLAMTWVGKNFAVQNIPIFSNYHTKIEGAMYIRDPFELLTCEGIVLVDEISKYANSRLSGDSRTIFYSEMTSEARKTTASLYYTDQRFMNVDTKIRNNTDYILFPEYSKQLHWCIVYAFEGLNYEKPLDVFEFDCIPIYKLFNTREKIESVYTDDKKQKLGELLIKKVGVRNIEKIMTDLQGAKA